jgi:O-antigen/teichoic acid export membrane protein
VLLYGDHYAPAVDAARLLVVGAAVQFISYLCFVTLASIGRTLAYAIAGCVGLVVNVLLNFALIPPFSFEGSAVATVATELGVVAFLLAVLARTTTLVDVPWRAIVNAIVAGSAMAGVYLGLELVVPWYVAIAGGLLAFLGTVHVLGADAPGGLPALLRAARYTEEADELGAP